MRSGSRRNDQVRNAKITRNYIKHAEGSVEKGGLQQNIICFHVQQQLESQGIYQD